MSTFFEAQKNVKEVAKPVASFTPVPPAKKEKDDVEVSLIAKKAEDKPNG